MNDDFKNQLILGDCLEVMPQIPDDSVDLIVTDPPFFKCKGREYDWDHQWRTPQEFIEWLDRIAEQWQRILKPNGSLYCFASSKMSARVEVMLGDRFNVLNRIRWIKEAGWHNKTDKEELRGYLSPWEEIIFCEHYGADNAAKGESGWGEKCDEAARDVFGKYIKQVRLEHELTSKDLTEVIGAYGRVNHGGACSNWESGKNVPTIEHYTKLQQAFPGYFTRPYEELRQQYEELRRPFNASPDTPYTDVWTFPTVNAYPGKHICEKPIPLLSHIISVSSRPDAVVLDCFAGSANTLVAAKQLGRSYIGIEKDEHWVNSGRIKLGQFDKVTKLPVPQAKMKPQKRLGVSPQLSLFDNISSSA